MKASIKFDMSSEDGKGYECTVSIDQQRDMPDISLFAEVISVTASMIMDTHKCTCPRCTSFKALCKEIVARVSAIQRLPAGEYNGPEDTIGEVQGHG